MIQNEQAKATGRQPVYQRLWFRITAFLLAMIMVFSIWANGAIQIRIQARSDQDAAVQYLINNTDYVQSGDLGRLEEKVQTYFQPTTLEDYYRLAGTQIGAGEYEAALTSVDTCLEMYSGGDEVLYLDLLLKRGCLHVLLGQYEQAVEALEQVLLEDPEQADAYLVLAQIYSEIGNYQGLVPILGEYLKLKPQDADIRVVLAQVLFQLGEYQQAITEYEQLKQLEDMSESLDQILLLEALAYIQLSDYTAAKEMLLNISDSEVRIPGRDYYLGVCYLSEEDYDSGEICFTASLDAGEMMQLSSYSRAVCRLMKNDFDYEGAMVDLEAAIAYSEEDMDPAITEQAQGLLDTILTQDTER
jgi:tetratricopeptide (TPR) repeat protein